ncbi:MAG: NAD(P)-dependent oxidoreductase, partial [Actinomycetota bacterium]
MLDTDLYMACIDLRNRHALVVGGGAAAAEKVVGLCASRADVLVVAGSLNERLRQLHRAGSIVWEERSYE